ncbi:MAG: adenylyl-sulfate kinase [Candidatus Bathyarchaeota archaeon]|nr:adenylyl-sulfate kinase [Candidatus Bathyarchaeota archaeon]
MNSVKGWAVWLTGLPGSGKSTLTNLLAKKLKNVVNVQVLSSDMLRKVLTPNPTYSEEERDLVYDVLVFIVKILTDNGVNVLIDATGNKRKYREKARKEVEKFMEVYVKCPLHVCIKRERKRIKRFGAPSKIYDKAFKGESKTVPGLGSPYEEPLNPEVVVETDKLTPKKCVEEIYSVLEKKFL